VDCGEFAALDLVQHGLAGLHEDRGGSSRLTQPSGTSALRGRGAWSSDPPWRVRGELLAGE
jgi:hypothetical protein